MEKVHHINYDLIASNRIGKMSVIKGQKEHINIYIQFSIIFLSLIYLIKFVD